MDEIRAHLKSFRPTDWLILIAVALIGAAVLDGIIGLIVGAILGYLGILAWRKGMFSNGRRPPDDPQP
jgi:ABC-type xylose transport system permease subunit